LYRVTTEELPGPQSVLQRELVALCPKTADDASRQIGKIRFPAERFPRKNIGKMNFNEWQPNSGEGITQSDAGMSVSCGIDNNEVHLIPDRLLNPVYQFKLGITLENREFYISLSGQVR
jgi:hypothetical protein